MKAFTIKKRGNPDILIESEEDLLNILGGNFVKINKDLLDHLDSNLKDPTTSVEFNKIIQKYRTCSSNCKPEFWTRRGYSEEEAKNLISNRQKELCSRNGVFTFSKREDNPNCVEFWIKRGYSDPIEIENLMDERKRKNSSRCKEFWLEKGFTGEEAVRKISENQDRSSSENFKKSMKENNRTWTQKQYWIDSGLTEEEAEQKLKEAQSTFSLDKCIEKHGLEEGTRIWQKRQDKWQDTLTSKSQEEIDSINKSKFSGGGFSSISQELFRNINISESRYGTNGGEYRIKLNSGKHVSLDYFYNGRVIEFNGDLWHANPKKYKEDDKPLETKFFGNTITAKDIWNKDAKRLEEIKELGYEVLVIWESEYRNNKTETINKCMKFLNKGKNNEN